MFLKNGVRVQPSFFCVFIIILLLCCPTNRICHHSICYSYAPLAMTFIYLQGNARACKWASIFLICENFYSTPIELRKRWANIVADMLVLPSKPCRQACSSCTYDNVYTYKCYMFLCPHLTCRYGMATKHQKLHQQQKLISFIQVSGQFKALCEIMKLI